MWKIDSDGDAQNIFGDELVTVVPTFTVKLWRIHDHTIEGITLKNFDSEAEAREFVRAYVAAQNWEDAHHAD